MSQILEQNLPRQLLVKVKGWTQCYYCILNPFCQNNILLKLCFFSNVKKYRIFQSQVPMMIMLVKGHRMVQRVYAKCVLNASFTSRPLLINHKCKSIPAEKIQSVWEEDPVWQKCWKNTMEKRETVMHSPLLDFLQC